MRRLLIRPGAIGDCILSFPALEHVCTEDTEIWAPSTVLPLIRFAGARTRSIASTGLDLLGLPGVEPPAVLIEQLRGFDSIYSWYGENRPEFRAALELIGPKVRFFAALPHSSGTEHCADFFARQVGAPTPAVPRIAAESEWRGDIVIHPFSGSKRKNWPLERFRELAQTLGHPVRWIAGPEDHLDGADRFASLYDLARFIAGARLYIGNDSGITHLAAAVGTPVRAYFVCTDPAVWGPRGPDVSIISGL